MARADNPQIGTIICQVCNEQATVHQSKRGRGLFLYYRDCECKVQQSQGKAMQTYIWKNATWLDGVPACPPNVEEGEPDFVPGEPEPEAAKPAKKEKPVTVDQDGEVVNDKPPAKSEEEESDGWVWGALALLGVAAVFVLTGGRRGPQE